MRSESICIEGISPAGFATATGEKVVLDKTLHAWTFMWLTKLAMTATAITQASIASAGRLNALVDKLIKLSPDEAANRLMRGRALVLAHRIERAGAKLDWRPAHEAILDELELRVTLLDGPLRGPMPRILAVKDYPEMEAFRLPGERPSPLSGEEVERELLRAFGQLQRIWPAALTEVRWYVDGVLPMEMADGHFNSASSDEVPFVVQVTIRSGTWPMLLAESLIHEMSHVKLDVAASMQALLTANSAERIYSHPWRPDRRPLIGVLLGAHAFLNVMIFYHRAVAKRIDADRAFAEFQSRREEVGQALEVLESNRHQFTPFGLAIFSEMQTAFRTTVST